MPANYRRQRNRRVVTIRGLPRIILGLFQDFAEIFLVAAESPDEFPWRAAALSAHWTPIIMRILPSGLPEIEELDSLINLVAFLDLEVEEFLEASPEQVEDVYNACANYTPLEPYWARMEPVLSACLHRMQVEVEQEEEEEEMEVG